MILQLCVLKEQLGLDSHNWPINRFSKNKWPLTRFIPGNSSALLHFVKYFVLIFSTHGQQERLKGVGGVCQTGGWIGAIAVSESTALWSMADVWFINRQTDVILSGTARWQMTACGTCLRGGVGHWPRGSNVRAKCVFTLQPFLLIDTCSGLCTCVISIASSAGYLNKSCSFTHCRCQFLYFEMVNVNNLLQDMKIRFQVKVQAKSAIITTDWKYSALYNLEAHTWMKLYM